MSILKRTGLKRCLACFIALMMIFSTLMTQPVSATRLKGFDDVGRMVSAESIVLLQNPTLVPDYPNQNANKTGKVLPIDNGEVLSVFGRAQMHYYYSGTGSGGDVKISDIMEEDNLLAGLRGNPKVRLNESLINTYKNFVASNPFNSDGLGGWNPQPFGQVEMDLSQSVANTAAANSDVAVVVIGRTAGEDHDFPAGSSDTNVAQMGYELSNREKTMISRAYAAFKRVVIVMNCANIMDMSWAKDYPNAAIMYTWAGGQTGGYAIADVLTGDVTPSGKLADTMADSLSAYYARGNTPDGQVQFGNSTRIFYGEDIYVGYRYFETYANAYERVLYPFGYGLSYTSFDITTGTITADATHINIPVTVKNTGAVKGKEVVQVYYAAPQGTLGNPAKELGAFAKTRVLYPGEEQAMTLSIKISEMASYDEAAASYKLLQGGYKIYVGNCVRAGAPWGTSCTEKYTYNVAADTVTKALTNVMPPVRNFQRIKPTGAADANGRYTIGAEDVPTMTGSNTTNKQTNAQARIDGLRTQNIAALSQYTPNSAAASAKLIDVYKGNVSLTDYINSLSRADLASIVIAPGMSPTSVPAGGSAGVFGGVTTGRTAEGSSDLKGARGVPPVTMADGPSGLRLQSRGNTVDGVNYSNAPYNLNQYATCFASGTAIACTWNTELAELLAEYWGQELLNNMVDVVLGPGINIHRFPLNGRNFEYFSEDPLLTGTMGAAIIRGVQSKGPVPTIKHYACNNQETGRHTSDSVVSERALREIYLKPFQISVEDGGARSVMTSYNSINGLWSANNPDLNTTLMRNEWGYTGFIMTDWWPNINTTVGSSSSGSANTVYMVRAQNDIYAVADGGSGNSQVTGSSHGNRYTELYNNFTESDTPTAGQITRKELSRSAKNILQFAMTTPAFARNNSFAFDTNFANASAAMANTLKFTPTPPAQRRFMTTGMTSGDPLLTGIKVGTRAVTTFHPLQLNYGAYLSDAVAALKGYPEVSATAEAGTTIKSITQANAKTPVAIIVAEKGGDERVYRVSLTANGGNILEDGVPAVLTDLKLNGTTIADFSPTTLSYGINWASAEVPVVTASLGAGSRFITPATSNGNGTYTIGAGAYDAATGMFTIIVESDDAVSTYQIRLVNIPKSDDFNTSEMSKNWDIHGKNEENLSFESSPGNLRVTAEYGDVYQAAGNSMKNIIYQYGYGNWESVVKFDMNHIPSQAYNGIGLMVFNDLDNYVWLDYEFNSSSGVGGRTVGMVQETNAVFSTVDRLTQGSNNTALNQAVGTATTVWMKMQKQGDVYTGSVSIDGVNYHPFASVTRTFAEPKIGITVYNGTASPQPSLFYADIDYAHFNPTEFDGTVTDIYSGVTLKPGELKATSLTEVQPPYQSELCDDADGGLAYVSRGTGETVGYKVNVKVAGTYTITARAKTNTDEAGAQMDIDVALGDKKLGSISPNATNSQWITMKIEDVVLPAGESVLYINFTRPGIRLNTLQFTGPSAGFNTTALEAALAGAPKTQGSYSAARWAEYLPFLVKAQKVAASPLSQKQIDNAAEELLEAIHKLESGLPINVPPKAMTVGTPSGNTRTDRIYFKDLPWMWMQSSDARFEGSGNTSNIGYVTTNDAFYLGYINTTGLREIKLNYSCGTTSTGQYHPSLKLDFYTLCTEGGTVNKTTTHSASSIAFSDLYRGGTMTFGNYFAGINFLHRNNTASWTVYGDSSTAGNYNASGRHANMTNYWEVGVKTFFNASMVGGWRNVYMRIVEGGGNFRYVDLVYNTNTVSFNLGYDGAPAAPASVTVTRGETLGDKFPAAPAPRDGYLFTGWRDNASGQTYTADTAITASGDITLTAQWRKTLDIQYTGNSVTLTTSLKAEGNLPAATNASLFLAIYDAKGALLTIKQATVSYNADSVTTVTLTADLPAGAKTVQAFLWNSSFVPLRAPEELTLQQNPD